MSLIIQLTSRAIRILDPSGNGPDTLVAEITAEALADAIHAGQRLRTTEDAETGEPLR